MSVLGGVVVTYDEVGGLRREIVFVAASQLGDFVTQVGLGGKSEDRSTWADLYRAGEAGEKRRGARIAYTLVGRNTCAADHHALKGLRGVKVLVVEV